MCADVWQRPRHLLHLTSLLWPCCIRWNTCGRIWGELQQHNGYLKSHLLKATLNYAGIQLETTLTRGLIQTQGDQMKWTFWFLKKNQPKKALVIGRMRGNSESVTWTVHSCDLRLDRPAETSTVLQQKSSCVGPLEKTVNVCGESHLQLSVS